MMRICVIGAGLSGLSTAHYLCGSEGTEITIVEQSAFAGGRANVDNGAEHCPRVFLNDYTHLFRILQEIPAPGGGTVFDSLHRLRRMVRVSTGWIEVSHLYRLLAREVPLIERVKLALANRRPRLVAEEGFAPNSNRYGSLRNYSLPSLSRLAANLFKSKTGYVLDGPTDELLVVPWLRHLQSLGVKVRTGTKATRIKQTSSGVDVTLASTTENFDAVVVTAFLPDVIKLLTASDLPHTLVDGRHVHCKALTITLHPAERVLTARTPSIYCHAGINLVLQPSHQRCVVLCTWSASTDVEFVLGQVREFLGLEYAFTSVLVRDNQLPEEGVFAADYLAPHKILLQGLPDIHFAGSYLDNSYPMDSGEGAVRTAFNVAERLRTSYGLKPKHAPAEVSAR